MADTTTLYVSETSLRLMVTKGKRIIKLADMPLDMNISEADTKEKVAQLVEKVRYLFSNNKIKPGRIILGISGLHCLTRPISLPEVPKALLEEAVIREARRVLPVPVEQLYISWQILSTSQDKIKIFLVAIPKHIADTIINIVTQAGFKPEIMDIKPMALARLARENTAIIVDVQPSEFDIIVLSKGLPQPIRTVSFPREAMSLRERLMIVKDDLERTVQFYNSNNPDNKIEADVPMLVSGELADETELYEYLGRDLGFKVTPLTSPLKCLRQLDPSHHLVNVGLALKALPKDVGPLLTNFSTLPLIYQPQKVSYNRVIALSFAVIAISIVVLFWVTVNDAKANIANSESALEASKQLVDKRKAQQKDLNNKIAAKESSIASLETSRSKYSSVLTDMTTTNSKMNTDLKTTVEGAFSGFDIETLTIASTRIIIVGKANSEAEVIQYTRDLAKTGRYDEITINQITIQPSAEGEEDEDGITATYQIAVKLKAETK